MTDDQGAGAQDANKQGANKQYWYNPTTGEVEEGLQSPWTDRMGPYASRDDAQRALDKAAHRTEDWDEEDRRWRGEE